MKVALLCEYKYTYLEGKWKLYYFSNTVVVSKFTRA